jgi:iron complex transport system substrate-binding protein
MNGLTRRRVIGATAGLATIAAFNTRRVRGQEASPAASGPRVVETIHGPVEVPANPQRIIAINFPSAIALIELGVTPVGVPNYLPALPPGFPDATAIEKIENEAYELDLEKIASLNPDLILGSDWLDPALQQAPYEDLSRIAPTALFEWQQAGGNWAAEAAGCAEAIGKTAELEALKKGFEDKAAEVKTTYAGVLAEYTWDIISASDAAWYLYGPSSSHGKVAAAAGIQFGAAADQTDGYVEYSLEQLNVLQETGALLVRSAGDTSLEVLPPLATFQSLPVVAGNRLYTTPYYFPSSYGLSSALLADIETGLKALQSA